MTLASLNGLIIGLNIKNQNLKRLIVRDELKELHKLVNILNPEFNYVKSTNTDIRETFRRVKEREQKKPLVSKFGCPKHL